MEEEIKKTEDEIITFEELKNKHPNVSMENLSKMVLICKNCGHKDLLINFLKNIENPIFNAIDPYEKPYREFKPRHYRTSPPVRYWSNSKENNKWVMNSLTMTKASKTFLNVMKERFEEYFFCPKCQSSLVALSSEHAKNNIMRVL